MPVGVPLRNAMNATRVSESSGRVDSCPPAGCYQLAVLQWEKGRPKATYARLGPVHLLHDSSLENKYLVVRLENCLPLAPPGSVQHCRSDKCICNDKNMDHNAKKTDRGVQCLRSESPTGSRTTCLQAANEKENQPDNSLLCFHRVFKRTPHRHIVFIQQQICFGSMHTLSNSELKEDSHTKHTAVAQHTCLYSLPQNHCPNCVRNPVAFVAIAWMSTWAAITTRTSRAKPAKTAYPITRSQPHRVRRNVAT
jgi:hypothetical protein